MFIFMFYKNDGLSQFSSNRFKQLKFFLSILLSLFIIRISALWVSGFLGCIFLPVSVFAVGCDLCEGIFIIRGAPSSSG